jgi:hypothetical protein
LVSPNGFREFEISNTDNLVFFRGVNQSFPTGVSVNDGEWHHLAVSIRMDAESWKINLFVDTVMVAQRTLPTYREIAAGKRHGTNQQACCSGPCCSIPAGTAIVLGQRSSCIFARPIPDIVAAGDCFNAILIP